MKRVLFALLFFSLVMAQTTDVVSVDAKNKARVDFASKTTAGTTNGIDISRVSPWNHTVQWDFTGTPATCQLSLEGSVKAVTGPWVDLSGPQDCTSAGMFHVSQKGVDYIRVNVSTLSGSTTFRVYYLGVR